MRRCAGSRWRATSTRFDAAASERRVMWWYRVFWRHMPIWHAQVSERMPGGGFAEMAGAARAIEAMGVRVVVVDVPGGYPGWEAGH